MKVIHRYHTGRSTVKTVKTEAEFVALMLDTGEDNFIESSEIGIDLDVGQLVGTKWMGVDDLPY